MELTIFKDLSPEELEAAKDLLPELYNTDTVGPVARARDWEKDLQDDLATGKGFIVRSKPFKKKMTDKNGEVMTKGLKEMWGIHSPLFGTDWHDEDSFADRYSCECGNLIGRVFDGRKCPKCGKKVKFVDVDLKIFAWIKINNPEFKLIHPLIYKKIDSFIGGNKGLLAQIIDFKMEMKLDGYYGPPDDVDISKNPFYGIGLYEFQKRFDEIMHYYYKKKKNKQDMYNDIMADRDRIFVSAVPVYSAVLREVYITNEEYSYTKVDKCYNALYGNVTKLNEEKDVENFNIAKINKNLFKAQSNLNDAWDLIFTSLNENEGLK